MRGIISVWLKHAHPGANLEKNKTVCENYLVINLDDIVAKVLGSLQLDDALSGTKMDFPAAKALWIERYSTPLNLNSQWWLASSTSAPTSIRLFVNPFGLQFNRAVVYNKIRRHLRGYCSINGARVRARRKQSHDIAFILGVRQDRTFPSLIFSYFNE